MDRATQRTVAIAASVTLVLAAATGIVLVRRSKPAAPTATISDLFHHLEKKGFSVNEQPAPEPGSAEAEPRPAPGQLVDGYYVSVNLYRSPEFAKQWYDFQTTYFQTGAFLVEVPNWKVSENTDRPGTIKMEDANVDPDFLARLGRALEAFAPSEKGD